MGEDNSNGSATGQLRGGWHELDIDGVNVAFEVRGAGPIVVVHSGGPGMSATYMRMPEVERFATVVYLDPVATGRSGRIPDGDYSEQAYARIAAELIRTLPGERAVFLGHSHGGMVALQLAVDHPEVLHGVIVYEGRATDIGLVEDATDRVDAFVRRFPGDADAEDARAAWGDAVAMEDPSSTDDVLTDPRTVRQRLLPVYLGDFRRRADVMERLKEVESFIDPNRQPGAAWDLRSALPEVDVPVAVFVGRYDFICGPRAAAEIWQDVPGAELVTFAESGHFPHLEEPNAFTIAVQRFVTAHHHSKASSGRTATASR